MIRKQLADTHLEELKRQEEDLTRQIKDEQMLFKMKQSNLMDKMDESEQYRDRYDRVLKIKSEKLDQKTEKHRAERDILL